jgi:hypothetical protein
VGGSTVAASFDAFGIRKYQIDHIDRYIVGWLSLTKARIYGLTQKGFEFISELSRDRDEIVENLDEIKEALKDLKPEEKRRGERAMEELKTFIRGLTQAEARAFIKMLAETLLQ